MKALLPAAFFATLGLPVSLFCAALLALIVVWTVNGKMNSTEDED